MSKKRIGFVSYWGWGRGQSYVTLGFVKMLRDEFDVFILKQFNNPVEKEFKITGVQFQEYPEYEIDENTFVEWIVDNDLDAVVFNEYNQWTGKKNNLIPLAKAAGCKVYAYLVWEKIRSLDEYKDYDRILVPTISFVRYLRNQRFRKFTYIPYSIDFSEFNMERTKNEVFTFFHPAGYGGVYERKNTKAVIEAFKLLNKPNTKLVITSQKKLDFAIPENVEIIDKDLTRRELIELYYKADVTILPSKWETIGIPILESIAAGTPVITTNVPPMNEFIVEGKNGYTCNVQLEVYPDIYVKAAIVNPISLKNKMETSMNKFLLDILKRNSRKIAMEYYNLEENKKYFIDFLNEDLK